MTALNEGTGFTFDNVQRNDLLVRRGVKTPQPKGTGTTLAGLVFKDGVILAADTRATAGDLVADKNTEKISPLTSNVYCAGSGTAADIFHVSSMVASALTLHGLDTGRQIRVITAETILKNHLRRYQGHVGVGLIVGGVDFSGPQLFTIFPHGSTDALPYATMGSGSLNAMSVLEAGYRDNLSKDEAIKLISRAIQAGIYNDLASGSNVDLAIITKEGSHMIRGHEFLMNKIYRRQHPPRFPAGPAKILKEKLISLNEIAVRDADAMDTT